MKAELRFKVCYSFSVTLPATPGSTTETYKRAPSIYGKLAYDKQIQEKVRAPALRRAMKAARGTPWFGCHSPRPC